MSALTQNNDQGYSQPRGLRLRITPELRDFLALSLWCAITFVQFRGDELLLYPLALYYAWAIWRDQAQITPLLVRAWVIFLFPAWCLISPFWAVVPMAAFKQAIYLTLTLMICLQVAATMSPRRILLALLLATGVIGIINLLYGLGTGNLKTGIFAQKNAMGKNMVVLWVIASAVVLDRDVARRIRFAAAGLAGIAIFMAFMSQSATAVILILATGALNLAGAIFLLGGLFRASRLSAFCFLISLIALAGCLVLPGLQMNPVDAVLGYFDKDTTLTGRTVLWTYAKEQIEEAPLLGVGAEGFWRYHASPLVQKIFEDFYKSPSDKFNFHNSYYEMAVHQGLIGLALALLALVWALYQVSRAALTLGTLPYIYFFTQALTVLVRTTTEADFLKPFVLFHMVLWIGALSAANARRKKSEATTNTPA